MIEISARDLFEKNNRFDLIYKILYLENINNSNCGYYKKLYLDSIEVFNNFKEDNKISANDFEDAFYKNYFSMLEKGFDKNYPIPINSNFQLYDGAHRLAIAYTLGINVVCDIVEHSDVFDYAFFKKRKISSNLADIGALEYVLHNEHAHIVQVFPIANKKNDIYIESILNKHGFVYYKKEININYNALIKIKQINYGKESWAGDKNNDYNGLKEHARECLALGKMRVYIFVCENISDAVNAKKEIRNLIQCGNFPIHINDDHNEAVRLANIYFNKNALDWLNSAPYNISTNQMEYENEFLNYCNHHNINQNYICMSGSSVLSLYGLRTAVDIDCIATNGIAIVEEGNISSHNSEMKYYPLSFDNLIIMHENYLVIDGIKYVSLNNIIKFKFNRMEMFKDVKDLYLMCIKKNWKKIMMNISTVCIYIPWAVLHRIRKRLHC